MCNKKLCSSICTIVILLITLVFSIVLFCKKGARERETLLAGGPENMSNIQKIYNSDVYKDAQTKSLDSALAELGLTVGGDENTYDGDDTDNQGNSNVQSIVEEVLSSRPIRGDKDARFTILEYTELHCPYCQRHAQANTINDVIDSLPGEVNSVSMHYIIHGETAQKLAAAMECVVELKPDVFYDVFEEAFNAYPVEMDALIEIATSLGVDKTSMQTCVDEGRYMTKVSDMMSQGNSVFGVTGTPGNVIIDRETGKFTLIPGAYPAEQLIQAINNMK